jgi:peptidoglycan hydrolase-like protein with peptidoglycan-binding domain
VYAHDLYVPYPGYLIKYNPTYYDPNVVLVQQHLNLSGFYLKEDGFFGSTTKQCVIWFQQDVNSARAAEGRTDFLTVDGIVGLKTWNALINDTAAE